jgi:hypothetical protein
MTKEITIKLSQADTLEKKVTIKPFYEDNDPTLIDTLRGMYPEFTGVTSGYREVMGLPSAADAPDLVRCITVYKTNTHNSFLEDLVTANVITAEFLQTVRNHHSVIHVLDMNVVERASLDQVDVILEPHSDTAIFNNTPREFELSALPYIVLFRSPAVKKLVFDLREKIQNKLFQLSEVAVNVSDDVMYASKQEAISSMYRIYLGDRLLVEREYPADLASKLMLEETVSLDVTGLASLRLESDYGVVMKEVTVDGTVHTPNATEFSLSL